MNLPRVRFTVRRVMAGIAVCAVALAVLREAPVVLVLIGPLIGSLWDVRKGGRGLRGGWIGGAITGGCLGFAGLVAINLQRPVVIVDRSDYGFMIVLQLLMTVGGGFVGLTQGIVLWNLRCLAAEFLPRSDPNCDGALPQDARVEELEGGPPTS